MINKKNFIDMIQAKVNETTGEEYSKKVCGEMLSAVIDSVAEILTTGETVRLDGIGTLKVSLRNARTGKNPRTGESIEIPAKYKVVLKAPDTADIQKKLNA